ncbi:MAG TPA: FTR1 family protein [Gemmatimonadaceae bacterium]|nr:FTR1 family protein [Gemmatimonadaceae bacterium]
MRLVAADKPDRGVHGTPAARRGPWWPIAFASAAALLVLFAAIAAVTAGGAPDPTAAHASSARVVDIAVLVFREGLESILVLTAITASMTSSAARHRKPIGLGSLLGGAATLVTWLIAVRIIDRLTDSLPALKVQAATGLLAIVVLLVVMNWFFHKVYWTGWIGLHTRRKQRLLADAAQRTVSPERVILGLALLGFTSVYREGFEVVLFLQSYRLSLGPAAVAQGVALGLAFTAAVGVLTFMGNRRLPYKKMLIITGVVLGAVLLVMVGEQAQEMQLAGWLPTTNLPLLARAIPAWAGLWFAVFPTVQTLASQAIAAVLVIGSYVVARRAARR